MLKRLKRPFKIPSFLGYLIIALIFACFGFIMYVISLEPVFEFPNPFWRG